ncbi:MAG: isoleucine--tRNA ligase [Chloroflexi bacterium]|nr:isoleucine--tRNA ligase [Chloroflexota bacterium]
MFRPVHSAANFPELEKRILEWWKEKSIFDKVTAARKGCATFTFYEGPPTANGNPGIHHVLSRTFKDVIPRFWTMKGYYVPRKAGWDTHGLPVELEVEKTLGLSSKADIEKYGIAQFNAKCRESVFRYLKEWDYVTERIGFWLDLKNPYITMENSYMESGWWIIKQLWDQGLIYLGYKVTPHCPRCGTSLSSHEVALGYKDNTDDPSVHIKFRIDASQYSGVSPVNSMVVSSPKPVYLLAWTTTPWTLPGNTALAVSPAAKYALVETATSKEYLILAQALLKSALQEEFTVISTFPGSDLEGLRYEPLFDAWLEKPGLRKTCLLMRHQPHAEKLTYPVIGGDFVSMDEGTGIVHVAPAFGEIDFEVGKVHNLDLVETVDLQGRVCGPFPSFDGKFVKEADPVITEDLKARGLLYRSGRILHTYPFCWRCDTPLIYYAKSSWYIRTTARKDRLIAANKEINWHPEHIKYGRFGDWLENNVDWAFSRERYWGTPLPVWRCERPLEHMGKGGDSLEYYECVGSLDELKSKPGLTGIPDPLDLHRPFIDQVTYACPKCGGRMRRVPEVIDCWFDSGAMPVAQWHYPTENKALFDKHFPADFICEAVDQTRGWFYSLHALSVLLFDKPCYRNVICLGHILDAKGEKMSKARGNVVLPSVVLESQGADALRWYLLTAAPAGNVRRFSTDQVTEVVRRFMLTLWNSYSFFVTYANIDKFDPAAARVEVFRAALDRWIISELHQLVAVVNQELEDYDPTTAARRIEDFVDRLSNWYVRRSRRRFWKSENDQDKMEAYSALHVCLATVCRLTAPFIPFLSEEMYQNLVRSVYPGAPESVHLDNFPVADRSRIDEQLCADTDLAIKLSSLGRGARSRANIKVRQPLGKALVKVRSRADEESLERVREQVMDEINVKTLELLPDEDRVLTYEVRPNLPVLGPKYGSELGKITAELPRLDARKIVAEAQSQGEIPVAGFSLSPKEILIGFRSKEGHAVSVDGGLVVAVETKITPDLAAEGTAREVVHLIQTMRRSADFSITDHIITSYSGGTALSNVVKQFGDYIKQETLSRELVESLPKEGSYTETHKIGGQEVVLGVARESGVYSP